MKNILILTAHPSNTGHTHQIAQAYKDTAEKKGNMVTIVDLYAPENELPYLRFENIKQYDRHPNVERFQKMVADAQEMVMVHPLWWGGAPAIMKNFFDQVFTAGFAFSWAGGKLRKLLKGKTGKVFMTAGGSMLLYRLFIIPPFKAVWKYFTLEYSGVKVTDFKVADKMSVHMTPEKFEYFLNKVRKSAENS
jgi:NAD(P)H dehydrogenase (quinone)